MYADPALAFDSCAKLAEVIVIPKMMMFKKVNTIFILILVMKNNHEIKLNLI